MSESELNTIGTIIVCGVSIVAVALCCAIFKLVEKYQERREVRANREYYILEQSEEVPNILYDEEGKSYGKRYIRGIPVHVLTIPVFQRSFHAQVDDSSSGNN